MKSIEEQKNNKRLLTSEIKSESVSPDYLYAVELLSEIETLSNEDFLEMRELLDKIFREDWWRRFGNPKTYLEMKKARENG